MGETTNQIKSEIGQQRGELGENLQQLEHKVKRVTDWRAQFEERPTLMMGAAFVGGFLLSALIGDSSTSGSGQSSQSRFSYSGQSSDARSSPGSSDGGDYWQGQSRDWRTSSRYMGEENGHRKTSAAKQQAAETFDTIRGALMGLAVTKLQSFLEEALPGFSQEREKVERKAAQQHTYSGQSQASTTSATTAQPNTGTRSPYPTAHDIGNVSSQQDESYTA